MDREYIDQFTQQILIDTGLNELPEDFRNDYLKQLSYELQRRLGILAVNSLDEESYVDFRKLIRQNPSRDLFSVAGFFKKRIPHFHELMIKGLLEFKAEISEEARELRSIKREAPVEAL